MKTLELDVVFSGSSTKIVGHIGAAVHLEEQPDIKVRRMAGTSGGALTAALWATLGAKESAKLLQGLNYDTYFEYNWKSFLNFVCFGYATTGWAYYNDLKKYLGDTTFEDLETDLSVIVSNVTVGKAEVWSKRTTPKIRLRDALYISTCIPGIFKPIDLNDQMYRDGAIYWNFPINLWADSPRPRMGFLFEDTWAPRPSDPWDGLKEIRMAIDRAIDSNVDLSVRDVMADPKTFVVRMGTHGVTALDFALDKATKQMLFERGQDSAESELRKVRRLADINDWHLKA